MVRAEQNIIRVTKCMDDNLVRLLGTYLNQKHNHTCVNDVNSAWLIDEVV
jgi:hypothetical protein